MNNSDRIPQQSHFGFFALSDDEYSSSSDTESEVGVASGNQDRPAHLSRMNSATLATTRAPRIDFALPSFMQDPSQLHQAEQHSPMDSEFEQQDSLSAVKKAFVDLLSPVGSRDAVARSFLDALRNHPEPEHVWHYLVQPIKEVSAITSVRLPRLKDGNHLKLQTYRPAPIYTLWDQCAFLQLDTVLNGIADYFKDIKPIDWPGDDGQSLKSRHSTMRLNPFVNRSQQRYYQQDRNLSDSGGIHKDQQGNIYVGAFDPEGFLTGICMVLNDIEGSTFTSVFKRGVAVGEGIYIRDNMRVWTQYQGRANGALLMTTNMGRECTIGRAKDGQLQMHESFTQKTATAMQDSATATADGSQGEAHHGRIELEDYVDGTQDLTQQFIKRLENIEGDRSRTVKQCKADRDSVLGLPFIPDAYRKITYGENGKPTTPLHVLSLPDGSYIGTRQAGIGVRTEWTYHNGRFTYSCLSADSYASDNILHATRAMGDKEKSKDSHKGDVNTKSVTKSG